MNVRDIVTAPILTGLAVLFLTAGLPDQVKATSVTLQAARDATIYEDSGGDLANGAGEFLFAGKTGAVGAFSIRRALLGFDLSSIPAGSTINSASLQLTEVFPSILTALGIELHRALADWTEGASDPLGLESPGAAAAAGDVTFNETTFGGTDWTTPGGDFAVAFSAAVAVSALADYNWTSVAMAADVQGWLDSPATNFGWFLKGTDETTASTIKRFRSSEGTPIGDRPELTIDFTPPAGGPGPQVPEPSTVLLLGSGLAGLAIWRKRKAV